MKQQSEKNGRKYYIPFNNMNGLKSLIKIHTMAGWIKKQDQTIYCLQEKQLTDKDNHWLRMKGWKKISLSKLTT
jgi:exonuclease III